MELPTKQPIQFSQLPSCDHIFHAQTHHPPLPPLYICSSPSLTSQIHSLRPSTIGKLVRSITELGTPHNHTPFLNRDIVKLRKELERGMSRERRQMMQFYILSIADRSKRAAAELYLARYKGFVLGPDGSLGFGLEEGGGFGGEDERAESSRVGDLEDVHQRSPGRSTKNCGVM
ncbi:hypothetical protein BKA65DRAFT_517616 [Rhexocercosporidium sp. MPI-PUGE-AT-0058]|nr:hypothetical protein BKA65DRAFT_517616 [Rhexocercosporidium sp. MPI-PUGE-AT-0058]